MAFGGFISKLALSFLDMSVVLLIVYFTRRTRFAVVGLLAMSIIYIIMSYSEVLRHVIYLGSPAWASHLISIFFLVGVSMYYLFAGVFFMKAANIILYFIFASFVLFAHRYIADFFPQFALLQYTLLGWFSSAIEGLVLIGFHFLVGQRISNGPLTQWWRE
ncbi:hypothetical protein [Brucella pituitosa]|uniref:hypothetical protein n=1 Tax=Brucella pituitosa TaxID=571256 RepID=UPI003F4AEB6D